MITIFKIIKNLLKFLAQLIILLQIILLILILLTAGYWFFSLLEINFLGFVHPLADIITKFVHKFYHQQVQIGGQHFDGSLLLFDLIIIAVIVGLSKLRYLTKITINSIDKRMKNHKTKLENEFNSRLQKETEAKMSKFSNIAILIAFEIHNIAVNNFLGGDKNAGVKEKTDEAFKEFQLAIKKIPNTKVAKTDNKMLILNNDFKNIEKLLDEINNSTSELKKKFRPKRWLMDFYASIDIYKQENDVKTSYATLQNLLELKIKNEIISHGNFTIRYAMCEEQNYEIHKKGHYDLRNEDDVSVWTIIKKF